MLEVFWERLFHPNPGSIVLATVRVSLRIEEPSVVASLISCLQHKTTKNIRISMTNTLSTLDVLRSKFTKKTL